MTPEILQQSDLFPSPVKLSGASEIQLAAIALNIVDSILEIGNSLQVAEYIKANEKLSEFIRSDRRFVNEVRDESEKHGKGGYTSESGAVIKLAETGTKYDYSKCNDPELVSLAAAFTKTKAALEERQEFLKKLPEAGLAMVDEETGESYSIYRPAKTSTSSFTVTLKKQ